MERHAFLVGYSDGTVRPTANITRAEVATIFFRLMSDEDRAELWSQTNPFPDVAPERWYNNAVSTMAAGGFFTGRPNGTFAPDIPITRAEFVVVIARVMGAECDGVLRFPDTVGHWAETYINAAASEGWITGFPDGTFRPDQVLNRAEAAALINRKQERVAYSEEYKLEHMLRFPDNTNPNSWHYLYIKSATNSYTSVLDGRAYDYGYVSGLYESWVRLIPRRDWSVLERPDSVPEDILR